MSKDAADAVADLWSGAERFFWANTRDKSAGVPPDRVDVSLLGRAVETLVGLSDAFPHWQSKTRDIVGSCARELCDVALTTRARKPSLEEAVSAGVDAAALSTALARIVLMSKNDLAASQKQAVADARSIAAQRLQSDASAELLETARQLLIADGVAGQSVNGSGDLFVTQVHPYVLYRLIRAIWLTLFVVRPALEDESAPNSPDTLDGGHPDATTKATEADLLHNDASQRAGGRGEVAAPRADDAREREQPLYEQLSAVKEQLLERVRAATRMLVADHQLQRVNRHEAVALAFCGAALALGEADEDRRYIGVALKSSLSAQADGGWPLTRVPGSDPSLPPLEVTGFELAAALAEALTVLLSGDELIAERVAVDLVPALLAAAGHTERMIVELDVSVRPRTGWCAELKYGDEAVETLASLMALEQTVALSRLAAEMRSREALASFDATDTRNEYWPDWIQWSTYKSESEPDSDVGILRWIDVHLVQPRLEADQPWARRKAEIVLMFGPPGTTKTTIVRSVAVGLGWPLVSLSPGDFIRDGLDLIEAQATKIFERLHDVTRAVVLFDECDELFRDRGQERMGRARAAADGGDHRGIGAFVTASMLPKLQDLHDRSQVLVFVLTNYYGRLDPAIKRLGRVDHKIGVGPADETQRCTTIRRELDEVESLKGCAGEAAAELSKLTRMYNRPELLQAAEQLVGKLVAPLGQGEQLDSAKIKSAAKAVDRQMRQGLAMDDKDLQHFERLADEVSAPHINPARSR